jgi:hypothetical protein
MGWGVCERVLKPHLSRKGLRGKAKAKTGIGKSDLPGLQGGPRKRDSVSYDPVRAPRLYPDPEEPPPKCFPRNSFQGEPFSLSNFLAVAWRERREFSDDPDRGFPKLRAVQRSIKPLTSSDLGAASTPQPCGVNLRPQADVMENEETDQSGAGGKTASCRFQ